MEAGAVGFVRGSSWISDAIIFFQRLRDRPSWNPFVLGEASSSHVFVGLDEDHVVEAVAGKGIVKSKVTEYNGVSLTYYRPLFLTPEIRDNLIIMMQLLCGQRYAYGKIVLLALDALFRTYWFSRRCGVTDFKVCAHVVAWLYDKVPTTPAYVDALNSIVKGKYEHPQALGYKFGVKSWKDLNVDLLQDFMAESVDWEQIV